MTVEGRAKEDIAEVLVRYATEYRPPGLGSVPVLLRCRLPG